MITRHIIVIGKVQGVFFRQSTVEKAMLLGIVGVVRNLEDGSVEIVATGTEEQIEELIKWCYIGPRKSKVEEVIVNSISLRQFSSFVIIR